MKTEFSKEELIELNHQLKELNKLLTESRNKYKKLYEEQRAHILRQTSLASFYTDCINKVSESVDNWQMQSLYVSALHSQN